jgi:hypothetical protein
MRGDKNRRRVDWWTIATVPISLFAAFTARDHGAPFWMQLVIVAAVAAILGILIGLVVRAVRRRPGPKRTPRALGLIFRLGSRCEGTGSRTARVGETQYQVLPRTTGCDGPLQQASSDTVPIHLSNVGCLRHGQSLPRLHSKDTSWTPSVDVGLCGLSRCWSLLLEESPAQTLSGYRPGFSKRSLVGTGRTTPGPRCTSRRVDSDSRHS